MHSQVHSNGYHCPTQKLAGYNQAVFSKVSAVRGCNRPVFTKMSGPATGCNKTVFTKVNAVGSCNNPVGTKLEDY